MALCSPIAEHRLRTFIDVFPLPEDPRVLDLCCGKAEILIQLLRRHGGEGLGVDVNPAFIDDAAAAAGTRLTAGGLSLRVQDATEFTTETPFDLVMCVGARPFGDRASTLRRLATMVRPGGMVLIGEGYWRTTPDPEYAEFLNESPEEGEVRFGHHITIAEAEGLRCLHTMATLPDELDDYDRAYAANVEAFIEAHPDDPDVEAMKTRIRPWRDAFRRWGKETMGFGWYLYRVPEPPVSE